MQDDSGFRALVEQAAADRDVEGLILTGSMATGVGTPWSDFDVRLIVRDDASEESVRPYTESTFPLVDLGVMTLSEFADYAAWGSPEVWDRPTFTHAQVLVDRSGIIRPLVTEKGRLPADQRVPFASAMLDAFINSVYRALKCKRKRMDLCVRIEATEAVTYALHVLFAWEGRLKPYPVWLEHDLLSAPLTTCTLTSDGLLAVLERIVTHGDIAALQHLLAVILDVAEAHGHGDVIAGWGDDIAWMRRPDTASPLATMTYPAVSAVPIPTQTAQAVPTGMNRIT